MQESSLNKSKISAVIVAHNEEKKLFDCLQSLNFADEIVVVLDKCSDNSKQIAQKFTNKIIEGSWKIEGARRNVSLEAATGEWILEIDADERVSKELAAEILSIAQNGEKCGYHIPIKNYIGKRLVRYGWLRIIGVIDKPIFTYHGLKKYEEDKEVHPTFNNDFKMKYLKNSLIHLVDDDISDLLARFNRYTNWRANDLIRKGKIKKSGFFYFLTTFKLRFFKSLIIKKGYKEGAVGVFIALLSGLYPFVSYIKAKEKLNNENS